MDIENLLIMVISSAIGTLAGALLLIALHVPVTLMWLLCTYSLSFAVNYIINGK